MNVLVESVSIARVMAALLEVTTDEGSATEWRRFEAYSTYDHPSFEECTVLHRAREELIEKEWFP
jgi:hypothetical protein